MPGHDRTVPQIPGGRKAARYQPSAPLMRHNRG